MFTRAVFLLAAFVAVFCLATAPAQADIGGEVSVVVMSSPNVNYDLEDGLEEDTEASQNRTFCTNNPFCEFPEGPVIYVGEGEDAEVPLSFNGNCPDTLTLTLTLFLNNVPVLIQIFPNGMNDVVVTIPAGVVEHFIGDGSCLELKALVLDNRALRITTCRTDVCLQCTEPPLCLLDGAEPGEMRMYDVQTGDTMPIFEVCALSQCGSAARVEMFARPPFMDPMGHRKSAPGREACITSRENDIVEGGFAEGTYWAKFKCYDLGSGVYEELKIGFRYTDPAAETCDEPPVCTILEGGALTVDEGGIATISVAPSSPCDGCEVSVEATSVPPFVTLDNVNADGLATYSVMPMAGDAGPYTATFTVTDCDGQTSECSIDINVAAPVILCEEDESQSPNDTYAGATQIDAGECADDMGVMINGVLDTPMVINGDVDFYRLTGLSPDQSYTATIVAGMNNQNGFTNTLLGWFADEGVIVASDDNSGSRAEYSKVEFVSDGAGAVTLAVTGYGDDDFNGLMTPGMPYDEYGHGGYMLLVNAIDTADTEEMPLERQADLNGDGVVDTGDLGVLIGLFGTTSN